MSISGCYLCGYKERSSFSSCICSNCVAYLMSIDKEQMKIFLDKIESKDIKNLILKHFPKV
jgi:hypothetical protein